MQSLKLIRTELETIIELVYRKISWILSVSQNIPQPRFKFSEASISKEKKQ